MLLTVLFVFSVAREVPAAPAGASLLNAAQQANTAAAVDAAVITGVVRDANGVVPNATVVVRSTAGGERRTVTGADGRFSITAPSTGPVVLIVQASGFGETRQTLAANANRQNLEIKVAPSAVRESVTVTASRSEQRLGDVPASVSVLSRDDIRTSPAVVADDVLRQIPTFSLFRRTSSLSSHPTTQGVSLRGIGPSGVSRTLVLLDGVPFNDPFGGWVYWTRVPLENASRIEVVDNSSSNLYGNYAMGGVINIVTEPASRRTLELRTQYGTLGSPKMDFSGSDVWGKVGVVVNGSLFKTDGFPIVSASERGLVDNNAAVQYRDFNVKADYTPTDRVRIFARTGHFYEKRDNGKASTFDQTEEGNDTTWTTASGGVQIQLPDQSNLQASVFGDNETFHSNALAVPAATAATPARSIGRMSTLQTVPTKGFGGMVQWSRALGTKNLFTAGTDWRWVDGDSQDTALDAQRGATPITLRVAGGTQRSLGAFVQDLMTIAPKLDVTLSARVDRWHNYNAHFLETTLATGLPTANNKPSLPERMDTVVSPRIASLYRVNTRVSAWADFGGGFRAPTLNELYRQFSVGAITTRANDQLGPERLRGGEVGIRVAPTQTSTIRATWYDNRIKNPVSNVTLPTPANTQQRQNLGRTRVDGLQLDFDYLLGSSFKVSGGYLFNRARVVEFAANPSLATNCPGAVAAGRTGEPCVLPQVPRHRGSLLFAYANPKYFSAALSIQVLGRQFDEDQNARAIPAAALAEAGYPASASTTTNPGLPKYTIVSITASRALGRSLEVFVGAQNLFDREYFVGTLPTTIGSPRMVNAGLRVRLMAR
jgi:outer membrane receptor protein involved in Fe transport